MVAEELRLKGEIATLLQQAESQDAIEDAQLGQADQANKLPDELARRETRLKRIQTAKALLEARYKNTAESKPTRQEQALSPDSPSRNDNGPSTGFVIPAADIVVEDAGEKSRSSGPQEMVPDKAQINFTDSESRIMRASNKGWDQCGNVQVVVDSGHQIIVAADVTDQANDVRQVVPMMAQAQKNVGEANRIEKASMDAGYFSETNVQWMQARGIDAYVATGRLKHGDSLSKIPSGSATPTLSVKDRMFLKIRTDQGKAIYARRKAIVEPVFGQIKQAMGCRQFLLRGMRKMRAEWTLICMSFNLRKLFQASRMGLA
ncbi:MAG: transposase [Patescibacteria group bacterium]|nr:transposase [Patescibacteria group bacterium]